MADQNQPNAAGAAKAAETLSFVQRVMDRTQRRVEDGGGVMAALIWRKRRAAQGD